MIPQAIILAAQASQARWEVPASVTIAQWALESGWGQHQPPDSNNPFGIKAREGDPCVVSYTREVIHGQPVIIEQRFSKFASLAEAFDAHGKLIATAPVYDQVMALADDPEAFARALTGVYATDPKYGNELIALMQGHDLGQYDEI